MTLQSLPSEVVLVLARGQRRAKLEASVLIFPFEFSSTDEQLQDIFVYVSLSAHHIPEMELFHALKWCSHMFVEFVSCIFNSEIALLRSFIDSLCRWSIAFCPLPTMRRSKYPWKWARFVNYELPLSIMQL